MKIFIGYDSHEPLAFHVLAHSILRRASYPVQIIPLVRGALGHIHTRRPHPTESTEFSMTRFLVPYLSGYQGHSIFMDCDMLCLTDLGDFKKLPIDLDKAVTVVKHDYVPKTTVKFLGHKQSAYPKKNWSSFMVFNNELSRIDPRLVDSEDAGVACGLHQFHWAQPNEIGSLPLEWNWLVGEYAPNMQAKILHYTLGGPWFPETANCDHADDWFRERDHMMRCG